MTTHGSRPAGSKRLSAKEFEDLRHTVQIRSLAHRGV